MSIFNNFFGRKKAQPAQPGPSQAAMPQKQTAQDPSKDPNMIRVFDAYGRELFITKEQWRVNVLPGSIKSQWNNPDQLYSIIFASLNDGFRSDILDAAKQLYNIDTDRVRATCVFRLMT
jgi:hypothetical protein